MYLLFFSSADHRVASPDARVTSDVAAPNLPRSEVEATSTPEPDHDQPFISCGTVYDFEQSSKVYIQKAATSIAEDPLLAGCDDQDMFKLCSKAVCDLTVCPTNIVCSLATEY
jgi:hypothetical protein